MKSTNKSSKPSLNDWSRSSADDEQRSWFVVISPLQLPRLKFRFVTNVPVSYTAELHGTLKVKLASGSHPMILTVNEALAVAPGARSPNKTDVLPAVTFGVHFGPDVCVSVNPFSCVAYAVPTLPFVAVTFNV